ncbi:inorganic pyrophosphatase [Gemmatimonadetes bacterium T265]|nr:inorganic pyrophosphatase [Gemmatimonadetes bacterium T265]
MTPPAPFAGLPTRPRDAEPEHVHAVVETPKGSPHKLDYEPDLGVFMLKKEMPAGHVFPYDFGFVPGTLGGDGDPLDVLVLMDEATYPGVLVEARLVGVFEAEQTERDGGRSRNDRLVAVAACSRRHADVRTLDDLGRAALDQIEHFFRSYNEETGKRVEFTNRAGPARAAELVDEGVKRAAEKR